MVLASGTVDQIENIRGFAVNFDIMAPRSTSTALVAKESMEWKNYRRKASEAGPFLVPKISMNTASFNEIRT